MARKKPPKVEMRGEEFEVVTGPPMNSPPRVYRCYARLYRCFLVIRKEQSKRVPDVERMASFIREIDRRNEQLKAIGRPKGPKNLEEAGHQAHAYLEGHPRALGGRG